MTMVEQGSRRPPPVLMWGRCGVGRLVDRSGGDG